jgi:hypothetical protein
LAPHLARLAFDELAVGEVSAPVPLDASTFVIVLVSERAANRPLSPEQLEAAKRRAVEDWVAGQFRTRNVEYHGFDNGYDSDTDAWVRAEVQRMNSMAGATP